MVVRLFLFLLLVTPTWALDFGGGFSLKTAHARPTLIADSAVIAPGSEFTLGVAFEMDPGWHLYWRNYGDIGDVPRFDLTLPDGFTAGEVQWPVPQRFESRSFVNFGYEKTVVYLIPVTAPTALPEGEIAISVDANWLVCNEGECVSDDKTLSLVLHGGTETVADSAGNARIAASQALLPRPLADSGLTLSAQQTATHITVTLRGDPLPTKPVLYPHARGLIDYKLTPIMATADDFSMSISFTRPEAPLTEEPAAFSGVLVLDDGVGYEFSSVWGAETAESATPAVVKPMAAGELLGTLLAAFLGGLILNLMPCVLPVVSIKVLSFVKAAGESRRAAMMQGLTFAAGVLVSFWVVAGVLLALRGLGASLGWGFQLQSPIFVLCLVMLLFLMALNMFGVFEIGTRLVGVGAGTSKKGLSGAFFSGVLATVVATPCTAPFMGAALGAALASSALISFTIFTALALGMASPYVILCAFPPLLRMVPKPGEWMIGFKQFLGFLLAATTVWLVGVYGSLEAT
ncbi:MAG: DsbC/DsbD-like thiol-disulfide interchange protein/cytochrome c biogenesis protein CcdA, partial [Rhodothermales bacterium]